MSAPKSAAQHACEAFMGCAVDWEKVGASSRALWARVADAVLASHYESIPVDEDEHA